jgi:putative tryptophan/tyrosine transport system substrate-binding protein
MRRREFIARLTGTAASIALSRPQLLSAQQPDRMRRIGILEIGHADDLVVQARIAALREGLEKLGWVVGRNLAIDTRWGVLNSETGQLLGKELLSLSPDVIFTVGTPGTKAMQQATKTVPIVFIFVVEPVDQGVVQSFSHPGGNITGFSFMEQTTGAKWLTLLTEIAPKVKQVAYLFSPKAAPYAHFYYEAAQAAGAKTGVQVDIRPVEEPADFEPILAHLGADGGAIFEPDAFLDNNLELAIDLTARYRVPALYGGGGSASAKAGGLISYNLDQQAQCREASLYLDRILRGERPADLPVQQPTRFRYIINLKTAKTLGLAVPLTMQMAADEVIE